MHGLQCMCACVVRVVSADQGAVDKCKQASDDSNNVETVFATIKAIGFADGNAARDTPRRNRCACRPAAAPKWCPCGA